MFESANLPARALAAIGGILINVAGSVAGRVLAALGIGVTSYTGLSTSLDWLKDQALDALDGVPATIISLLSFMKVGTCINIIITAIGVRLVITGMTSDVLKRWVLK